MNNEFVSAVFGFRADYNHTFHHITIESSHYCVDIQPNFDVVSAEMRDTH